MTAAYGCAIGYERQNECREHDKNRTKLALIEFRSTLRARNLRGWRGGQIVARSRRARYVPSVNFPLHP